MAYCTVNINSHCAADPFFTLVIILLYFYFSLIRFYNIHFIFDYIISLNLAPCLKQIAAPAAVAYSAFSGV